MVQGPTPVLKHLKRHHFCLRNSAPSYEHPTSTVNLLNCPLPPSRPCRSPARPHMVEVSLADHSRRQRVAQVSGVEREEGGTSASCGSLPSAPAHSTSAEMGVPCLHSDQFAARRLRKCLEDPRPLRSTVGVCAQDEEREIKGDLSR